MDLATGDDYKINGGSVLNATTLGSGVVNSSLTTLGTVTGFTSTGIDDNATSTWITLFSDDFASYGTTDKADGDWLRSLFQDGVEIQADTAQRASLYQFQFGSLSSGVEATTEPTGKAPQRLSTSSTVLPAPTTCPVRSSSSARTTAHHNRLR
jgi:hypothetical protein